MKEDRTAWYVDSAPGRFFCWQITRHAPGIASEHIGPMLTRRAARRLATKLNRKGRR